MEETLGGGKVARLPHASSSCVMVSVHVKGDKVGSNQKKEGQVDGGGKSDLAGRG